MSDLQELVFDGKQPIEWGIVRNHCTMAALFVRLKQYDSMYGELKMVVEAARRFDMRPDHYSVSSVLLGETKKERIDFEISDSRTLCEIARDKWLTVEDFDVVRNTEEFEKMIQALS